MPQIANANYKLLYNSALLSVFGGEGFLFYVLLFAGKKKVHIEYDGSAYHSFRNHEKKATKSDGTEIEYADKQGFWKIATLGEIREKDYNLTPASYVGVVPIEEDTEPFDEKMKRLTKKLYNVIDESQKLDEEIKHQLNEMGWNQDFKEE